MAEAGLGGGHRGGWPRPVSSLLRLRFGGTGGGGPPMGLRGRLPSLSWRCCSLSPLRAPALPVPASLSSRSAWGFFSRTWPDIAAQMFNPGRES